MFTSNLIYSLQGDRGQEEQVIHDDASLTGGHDAADSHTWRENTSHSRRGDNNRKNNKELNSMGTNASTISFHKYF